MLNYWLLLVPFVSLLVMLYLSRDPAVGRSIMVRYGPPKLKNGKVLRPAIFGVIVDEKADMKEVSGTLIDLASRGYLKFKALPSKIEGKFPNFELIKLKGDESILRPYERTLYRALFGGRDKLELADLKGHLFKQLGVFYEEIHEELVNLGCYRLNPQQVKWRIMMVGGISLSALLIGGVFWSLKNDFSLIVTIAIWLEAVVLTVFAARIFPGRTVRGVKVLKEARGLEEFILRAKADKIRFLEKQGMELFETLLPYALAIGAGKEWTKRFSHLAHAPSWIDGVDFDHIAEIGTDFLFESLIEISFDLAFEIGKETISGLTP